MLCTARFSDGGCELRELVLSPKLNKFEEMNFYHEDDSLVILCEGGYVLNAKQLLHQYAKNAMSDLIRFLYHTDKQRIGRELLGEYVVVVYDKVAKELLVYNDLLSKKSLYYYCDEQMLVCSTSFFELCDTLNKRSIALVPDEIGARMMAHRHVFFGDYTYYRNIRWLTAFHAICCNSKLEVIAIANDFEAYTPDLTEEQLIEQIHALFTQGCMKQFELNSSFGYRQVYSLSGGMDSRATLLTGIENDYKPDLSFTYAESGSLDQEIPVQIATKYGFPNVFYALDGGNFILERESIIEDNEGQMFYMGSTGAHKMASVLDCSQIGIVHTGLGGGEILGDICREYTGNGEDFFRAFVDSLNIADESQRSELLMRVQKEYASYNEFMNLNDIRACLNFSKTTGSRFCACSPFLYEPFFCFMMSVPYAIKRQRGLYQKWYNAKFDNSLPTTAAAINHSSRLVVKTATFSLKLRRKLASVLMKRYGIKSRYDMNPTGLWLQNNKALGKYMDEAFAKDMRLIESRHSHIAQLLREAYANGTTDKLACLTASLIYAR